MTTSAGMILVQTPDFSSKSGALRTYPKTISRFGASRGFLQFSDTFLAEGHSQAEGLPPKRFELSLLAFLVTDSAGYERVNRLSCPLTRVRVSNYANLRSRIATVGGHVAVFIGRKTGDDFRKIERVLRVFIANLVRE